MTTTNSDTSAKYRYSEEGLSALAGQASDGRTLRIIIKNIRRERTGVHGLVALALEGAILAYDTFNLGRHEERRKLASGASKALDAVVREEWPLELVQHELDLACLQASTQWESSRYQVERIDPSVIPAARIWLIRPYIQEEGGTIFFGPPKSGKSQLLQMIAIGVATGHAPIWAGIQRRPTLYVNMERSRREFQLREAPLRRLFGVQGDSGVDYLHVRGAGLRSIAAKVEEWTSAHAGGLVCYDSISRSGLGGLNEDTTANEWTDTVNRISPTWAAIAHTPRKDGSHLFGSMHFEAGQDVGVQVSAEAGVTKMGVSLHVVQANATAPGHRQFFALEFDAEGVIAIRGAEKGEFPELSIEQGEQTPAIRRWLLEHAQGTVFDIAAGLKIDADVVRALLNKYPSWFRQASEGGGRGKPSTWETVT